MAEDSLTPPAGTPAVTGALSAPQGVAPSALAGWDTFRHAVNATLTQQLQAAEATGLKVDAILG